VIVNAVARFLEERISEKENLTPENVEKSVPVVERFLAENDVARRAVPADVAAGAEASAEFVAAFVARVEDGIIKATGVSRDAAQVLAFRALLKVSAAARGLTDQGQPAAALDQPAASRGLTDRGQPAAAALGSTGVAPRSIYLAPDAGNVISNTAVPTGGDSRTVPLNLPLNLFGVPIDRSEMPELIADLKKRAMLPRGLDDESVQNRNMFEEDLVEAVETGPVEIAFIKIQDLKGQFNSRGEHLGLGHQIADLLIDNLGPLTKTFIQGELSRRIGPEAQVRVYIKGPEIYLLLKGVTEANRAQTEAVIRAVLEDASPQGFRATVMKKVTDELRQRLMRDSGRYLALSSRPEFAEFMEEKNAARIFNLYGGVSTLSLPGPAGDWQAAVRKADALMGEAAAAAKFQQLALSEEGPSRPESLRGFFDGLEGDAAAIIARQLIASAKGRAASGLSRWEDVAGQVEELRRASPLLANEFVVMARPVEEKYDPETTVKQLLRNLEVAADTGNAGAVGLAVGALIKKMIAYDEKSPLRNFVDRKTGTGEADLSDFIDEGQVLFDGNHHFLSALRHYWNRRPEGRFVQTFRAGGDEYGGLIWQNREGRRTMTVFRVDGNNVGATTTTLGLDIGDIIINGELHVINSVLQTVPDTDRALKSIPAAVEKYFRQLEETLKQMKVVPENFTFDVPVRYPLTQAERKFDRGALETPRKILAYDHPSGKLRTFYLGFGENGSVTLGNRMETLDGRERVLDSVVGESPSYRGPPIALQDNGSTVTIRAAGVFLRNGLDEGIADRMGQVEPDAVTGEPVMRVKAGPMVSIGAITIDLTGLAAEEIPELDAFGAVGLAAIPDQAAEEIKNSVIKPHQMLNDGAVPLDRAVHTETRDGRAFRVEIRKDRRAATRGRLAGVIDRMMATFQELIASEQGNYYEDRVSEPVFAPVGADGQAVRGLSIRERRAPRQFEPLTQAASLGETSGFNAAAFAERLEAEGPSIRAYFGGLRVEIAARKESARRQASPLAESERAAFVSAADKQFEAADRLEQAIGDEILLRLDFLAGDLKNPGVSGSDLLKDARALQNTVSEITSLAFSGGFLARLELPALNELAERLEKLQSSAEKVGPAPALLGPRYVKRGRPSVLSRDFLLSLGAAGLIVVSLFAGFASLMPAPQLAERPAAEQVTETKRESFAERRERRERQKQIEHYEAMAEKYARFGFRWLDGDKFDQLYGRTRGRLVTAPWAMFLHSDGQIYFNLGEIPKAAADENGKPDFSGMSSQDLLRLNALTMHEIYHALVGQNAQMELEAFFKVIEPLAQENPALAQKIINDLTKTQALDPLLERRGDYTSREYPAEAIARLIQTLAERPSAEAVLEPAAAPTEREGAKTLQTETGLSNLSKLMGDLGSYYEGHPESKSRQVFEDYLKSLGLDSQWLFETGFTGPAGGSLGAEILDSLSQREGRAAQALFNAMRMRIRDIGRRVDQGLILGTRELSSEIERLRAALDEEKMRVNLKRSGLTDAEARNVSETAGQVVRDYFERSLIPAGVLGSRLVILGEIETVLLGPSVKGESGARSGGAAARAQTSAALVQPAATRGLTERGRPTAALVQPAAAEVKIDLAAVRTREEFEARLEEFLSAVGNSVRIEVSWARREAAVMDLNESSLFVYEFDAAYRVFLHYAKFFQVDTAALAARFEEARRTVDLLNGFRHRVFELNGSRKRLGAAEYGKRLAGVIERGKSFGFGAPILDWIPTGVSRAGSLGAEIEAILREVRETAAEDGLVPGSLENAAARIIAILKEDASMKTLFEASSGVREEKERPDLYTIEAHTLRVIRQFEKYFSRKKLPDGVDLGFMLLVFVFHDIGKPLAVQAGDKRWQHEFTRSVIEGAAAMLPADFREKIGLALAIIDGDPLGEYLKIAGKKKVPEEEVRAARSEAVEELKRSAAAANMDLLDFLTLLIPYYQSDLGSYTEDAGALKAMDHMFEQGPKGYQMNPERGRLRFSGFIEQQFSALESDVEDAVSSAVDTLLAGIPAAGTPRTGPLYESEIGTVLAVYEELITPGFKTADRRVEVGQAEYERILTLNLPAALPVMESVLGEINRFEPRERVRAIARIYSRPTYRELLALALQRQALTANKQPERQASLRAAKEMQRTRPASFESKRREIDLIGEYGDASLQYLLLLNAYQADPSQYVAVFDDRMSYLSDEDSRRNADRLIAELIDRAVESFILKYALTDPVVIARARLFVEQVFARFESQANDLFVSKFADTHTTRSGNIKVFLESGKISSGLHRRDAGVPGKPVPLRDELKTGGTSLFTFLSSSVSTYGDAIFQLDPAKMDALDEAEGRKGENGRAWYYPDDKPWGIAKNSQQRVMLPSTKFSEAMSRRDAKRYLAAAIAVHYIEELGDNLEAQTAREAQISDQQIDSFLMSHTGLATVDSIGKPEGHWPYPIPILEVTQSIQVPGERLKHTREQIESVAVAAEAAGDGTRAAALRGIEIIPYEGTEIGETERAKLFVNRRAILDPIGSYLSDQKGAGLIVRESQNEVVVNRTDVDLEVLRSYFSARYGGEWTVANRTLVAPRDLEILASVGNLAREVEVAASYYVAGRAGLEALIKAKLNNDASDFSVAREVYVNLGATAAEAEASPYESLESRLARPRGALGGISILDFLIPGVRLGLEGTAIFAALNEAILKRKGSGIEDIAAVRLAFLLSRGGEETRARFLEGFYRKSEERAAVAALLANEEFVSLARQNELGETGVLRLLEIASVRAQPGESPAVAGARFDPRVFNASLSALVIKEMGYDGKLMGLFSKKMQGGKREITPQDIREVLGSRGGVNETHAKALVAFFEIYNAWVVAQREAAAQAPRGPPEGAVAPRAPPSVAASTVLADIAAVPRKAGALSESADGDHRLRQLLAQRRRLMLELERLRFQIGGAAEIPLGLAETVKGLRQTLERIDRQINFRAAVLSGEASRGYDWGQNNVEDLLPLLEPGKPAVLAGFSPFGLDARANVRSTVISDIGRGVIQKIEYEDGRVIYLINPHSEGALYATSAELTLALVQNPALKDIDFSKMPFVVNRKNVDNAISKYLLNHAPEYLVWGAARRLIEIARFSQMPFETGGARAAAHLIQASQFAMNNNLRVRTESGPAWLDSFDPARMQPHVFEQFRRSRAYYFALNGMMAGASALPHFGDAVDRVAEVEASYRPKTGDFRKTPVQPFYESTRKFVEGNGSVADATIRAQGEVTIVDAPGFVHTLSLIERLTAAERSDTGIQDSIVLVKHQHDQKTGRNYIEVVFRPDRAASFQGFDLIRSLERIRAREVIRRVQKRLESLDAEGVIHTPGGREAFRAITDLLDANFSEKAEQLVLSDVSAALSSRVEQISATLETLKKSKGKEKEIEENESVLGELKRLELEIDAIREEVGANNWGGATYRAFGSPFVPRGGYTVLTGEEVATIVNEDLTRLRRSRAAMMAAIEKLTSDTRSERMEGVRELSQLKDRESLKALFAIWGDRSGLVRKEIAIALGLMKYKEAVPYLIQYLEDQDDQVRWMAAVSLSRFHEPVTIGSAVKALIDTRTQENMTLAGMIQSKRAYREVAGALEAALSDPDPYIRSLAAVNLGRLADPAKIVLIRPLLEETDPAVRDSAVEAFYLVGGPEAVQAISDYLASGKEKDPYIIVHAAERLRQLTGVRPAEPAGVPAPDPAVAEAFSGTLVGLAVGDMMGSPVEGLLPREFQEKTGVSLIEGYIDPFASRGAGFKWGQYTDDTEMALALVDAVLRDRGFNPHNIGTAFGQLLRGIDEGERPDPGYGRRTQMAGRRLNSGVNWRNAGSAGATTGAAMRVAGIGLLNAWNPSRLKEEALVQSQITHSDREAQAAAVAVAFIVGRLLAMTVEQKARLSEDPAAKADFVRETAGFVKDLSPNIAGAIEALLPLIQAAPEEIVRRFGRGGAKGVVVLPLYFFLRSPRNYRETVLAAVNVGGDADTLAAVAGAMSGAFNGEAGIPEEWRKTLSGGDTVRRSAERVYDFFRQRQEEVRIRAREALDGQLSYSVPGGARLHFAGDRALAVDVLAAAAARAVETGGRVIAVDYAIERSLPALELKLREMGYNADFIERAKKVLLENNVDHHDESTARLISSGLLDAAGSYDSSFNIALSLIRKGYRTDEKDVVLVDHLDGDSVLAAQLLLDPSGLTDEKGGLTAAGVLAAEAAKIRENPALDREVIEERLNGGLADAMKVDAALVTLAGKGSGTEAAREIFPVLKSLLEDLPSHRDKFEAGFNAFAGQFRALEALKAAGELGRVFDTGASRTGKVAVLQSGEVLRAASELAGTEIRGAVDLSLRNIFAAESREKPFLLINYLPVEGGAIFNPIGRVDALTDIDFRPVWKILGRLENDKRARLNLEPLSGDVNWGGRESAGGSPKGIPSVLTLEEVTGVLDEFIQDNAPSGRSLGEAAAKAREEVREAFAGDAPAWRAFEAVYANKNYGDALFPLIARFARAPGLRNVVLSLTRDKGDGSTSGAAGEIYHAARLQDEGYEIVSFGFDVKDGKRQLLETDLLVKKDGQFYAVEIKHFSGRRFFRQDGDRYERYADAGEWARRFVLDVKELDDPASPSLKINRYLDFVSLLKQDGIVRERLTASLSGQIGAANAIAFLDSIEASGGQIKVLFSLSRTLGMSIAAIGEEVIGLQDGREIRQPMRREWIMGRELPEGGEADLKTIRETIEGAFDSAGLSARVLEFRPFALFNKSGTLSGLHREGVTVDREIPETPAPEAAKPPAGRDFLVQVLKSRGLQKLIGQAIRVVGNRVDGIASVEQAEDVLNGLGAEFASASALGEAQSEIEILTGRSAQALAKEWMAVYERAEAATAGTGLERLRESVFAEARKNADRLAAEMAAAGENILDALERGGNLLDAALSIEETQIAALLPEALKNPAAAQELRQVIREAVLGDWAAEAPAVISRDAARIDARGLKIFQQLLDRAHEQLETRARALKVFLVLSHAGESMDAVLEALRTYGNQVDRLVVLHRKEQKLKRESLRGFIASSQVLDPANPAAALDKIERGSRLTVKAGERPYYVFAEPLKNLDSNFVRILKPILTQINQVPDRLKRQALDAVFLILFNLALKSPEERELLLGSQNEFDRFLGQLGLDFLASGFKVDNGLQLNIAGFISSIIEAVQAQEAVAKAA
jgi:ADP-ribosylglycohydrolase/HEAT repeat protein